MFTELPSSLSSLLSSFFLFAFLLVYVLTHLLRDLLLPEWARSISRPEVVGGEQTRL